MKDRFEDDNEPLDTEPNMIHGLFIVIMIIVGFIYMFFTEASRQIWQPKLLLVLVAVFLLLFILGLTPGSFSLTESLFSGGMAYGACWMIKEGKV